MTSSRPPGVSPCGVVEFVEDNDDGLPSVLHHPFNSARASRPSLRANPGAALPRRWLWRSTGTSFGWRSVIQRCSGGRVVGSSVDEARIGREEIPGLSTPGMVRRRIYGLAFGPSSVMLMTGDRLIREVIAPEKNPER